MVISLKELAQAKFLMDDGKNLKEITNYTRLIKKEILDSVALVEKTNELVSIHDEKLDNLSSFSVK